MPVKPVKSQSGLKNEHFSVFKVVLGESMDVVYFLKECSYCEELNYSLRSLENLPHDKVFIVGGCPRNIQNVEHRFISQRGNKYKNTTNSLKHICKDKDLSEDFILMNDDFFILKPVDEKDLIMCRGYVKDVLAYYKKRFGENDYSLGMEQTEIFLKDLGIEKPLSYELHTPLKMNKGNVLKMFELPYIDSLSIVHTRTLYGNLFYKDSEVMEDVKVYKNTHFPIKSGKFLSCEDASWPMVRGYVEKLFPNKSRYEI